MDDSKGSSQDGNDLARNPLIDNTLGVPIDASIFVEELERYKIDVPEGAGPLLVRLLSKAVKGNLAALPMLCKGEKCPFLGQCWIRELNDRGHKTAYPIGKQCPQEMIVLELWIKKLAGNIGLNPDNPEDALQLELVYELATNELMRYRAAFHLSTDPELVKKSISAYGPKGEPVWEVKINPATALHERLSRLILKLKEQMLATPKAQAQVGRVLDRNVQETLDKRRKAEELLKQRQAARIRDAAKDAEMVDEQ